MKHPFELNSVTDNELDAVQGATSIPIHDNDFINRKIALPVIPRPPIYITMAIGEDGGDFPHPILM